LTTFDAVTELVVSALYAIGATHQASRALRHSQEFLVEMAKAAPFQPAQVVIEESLVPNAKPI
jgi:hypothetical protein